MKGKIAMIAGALLLTALPLTGCGNSEGTASKGAVVTVSTVDVPSTTEQTASVVSEMELSVVNKTLEQDNIKIDYPVLDIEADSVKTSVNQLIAQDANACLKAITTEKTAAWTKAAVKDLTGAIEHTILSHDNVISVIYTGTLVDNDGNTKMVVATTNLDRTTGNRISTGVPENAEKIAKAIHGDKVAILERDSKQQQAQKKMLKAIEEDTLVKLLQNCDFADENTAPSCYSYLMDEDNTKICIYMPLDNHAANYALVSVDLETLS